MRISLQRQYMNKGLKDVREPCGYERKACRAAGRASARALRQAHTECLWSTEEAHVPGAEELKRSHR